jgi:pyruvate dehydrogenase E1 component
VTLAPEGGAHQSIGAQLIGMSQDGLVSFGPAFLDELSIIMDWSLDYLQRDGEGDPDERTWLRDETGGSAYLRLSTRPLEQFSVWNREDAAFRQGVIDGGYWLRQPGPNCEVVIAYQGVVAPEAIKAAARIGEGCRNIGVLTVTSADRLNSGWTAARRARARGQRNAKSQIERLMEGHAVTPLGGEHFGQTGTIRDLYRHFQIDADAIVGAASHLSPGRILRRNCRIEPPDRLQAHPPGWRVRQR